jgi:hypothetical protein
VVRWGKGRRVYMDITHLFDFVSLIVVYTLL